MAQLRDTKTSELIAEGTPLELALIAEELGRDEVLFDDVGVGFDPAAVIAAHRENLAGIERAARDAAGADKAALEQAHRDASDAAALDADTVAAASGELEAARARLDG